jgi:hypothetical protein
VDAVERRRLLKRLVPDPELADEDPAALREAFDLYCAEGLHVASRDRTSIENFRFLTAMANRSGAFAFLALQQFVAAAYLADGESARIGVAFGHLRRSEKASVLRQPDGRLNGVVPWFTGSHVFEEVVLGFHDGREEVFARVPAGDRTEFRHGNAMPLIAMTSTMTTSVAVSGLIAGDSAKRQPIGTMREGDRKGVVWQTPLMLGNLQGSLEILLDSDLTATQKSRLEARTMSLESNLYAAMSDSATAAAGLRLRSEVGALSVRQARLAVFASGGKSLLKGHRAERLYREALLLNLMAANSEIVADAVEEDLS